jgi:MraZ protein
VAFRGLYEHSLDSKDRLTVPSRFRAPLADGIVLSKGFDPCVWVHTTSEFEQLSDRFLSPHSPFGADARALRRRFHGGSFDEKLDSWAKQEEELDAAAPEIAEGLAAAGTA